MSSVWEKILIVENDRARREAILEVLKSEGFPSEGVEDVARAERVLVERGPFRAVVVIGEATAPRAQIRTPVITLTRRFRVEELLSALSASR